MEALVELARVLGTHGKQRRNRKRADGTHDYGKLRAHKGGNRHSGKRKGQTSGKGGHDNAAQTVGNARAHSRPYPQQSTIKNGATM